MPRLSILIPYLGQISSFETTLASVLQNRPGSCQIMVAHRGDYQDPWNLGDEVEFLAQRSDATLLDLVNAGLHEARAEVFHVLTAGTEVYDGWTIPVLSHFAYPRVGAVAPLLLDCQDTNRVLARGLMLSRHGDRVVVDQQSPIDPARPTRATTNQLIQGPLLAAAFYRTDALLDLGGFDTQLGSDFADVDIAAMLQTVGYRCVHEPECRLLSPKLSSVPWSMTTGRQAERLYWRHLAQAGKLARITRPVTALRRAFFQPHVTGGYRSLVGRIGAWAEHARYQKFHDSLALLRNKIQKELHELDPYHTLSTDDRDHAQSDRSRSVGDRRAA